MLKQTTRTRKLSWMIFARCYDLCAHPKHIASNSIVTRNDWTNLCNWPSEKKWTFFFLLFLKNAWTEMMCTIDKLMPKTTWKYIIFIKNVNFSSFGLVVSFAQLISKWHENATNSSSSWKCNCKVIKWLMNEWVTVQLMTDSRIFSIDGRDNSK